MFGEPIRTEQYQGQEDDLDVLMAIRDSTRSAIEQGLQELREIRSNDPMRFASKSSAKFLAQWFGSRKNSSSRKEPQPQEHSKLESNSAKL